MTQIDRNGRVIDFQKQKGKLHIIEQEFKQAERIEYWRQKEVSPSQRYFESPLELLTTKRLVLLSYGSKLRGATPFTVVCGVEVHKGVAGDQ